MSNNPCILPDSFAIFILTHGRPRNLATLETLKKCNYRGRWFLVVDDQDAAGAEYVSRYGREKVLIFNKEKAAARCDSGNNFGVRKTILMARNACWDLAESIGITHFLQLDDDYTCFELRFLDKTKTKALCLKAHKIAGHPAPLDFMLSCYLRYFIRAKFTCLALAQGGDFIGGAGNQNLARPTLLRKAMNSFFCATDKPFKFLGIMNEDVSAYTTLGSRGALFGTVALLSIIQIATQSQSGGVTETYKLMGTYCKSFLSVMMMPSSVRVAMMQSKNPRLHHSINWAETVPKIIDARHKRKTAAMREAP